MLTSKLRLEILIPFRGCKPRICSDLGLSNVFEQHEKACLMQIVVKYKEFLFAYVAICVFGFEFDNLAIFDTCGVVCHWNYDSSSNCDWYLLYGRD